MRTAVLLASLLLALPAFADTPQQEKMKTCNAEAAKQSLKGDARKSFMKECLSANKGSAAEPEKGVSPQQAKMKQCNADAAAKNLKGEDRKKFMSGCLKAK